MRYYYRNRELNYAHDLIYGNEYTPYVAFFVSLITYAYSILGIIFIGMGLANGKITSSDGFLIFLFVVCIIHLVLALLTSFSAFMPLWTSMILLALNIMTFNIFMIAVSIHLIKNKKYNMMLQHSYEGELGNDSPTEGYELQDDYLRVLNDERMHQNNNCHD